MATYSFDDLKGKGIFIPAFSGSMDFVLHSPNFSSYFTLETVRNEDGVYDISSPVNTSGSFTSLVNVHDLISSSYIASFVVSEGTGSFNYTPNNAVLANTLFLRATGNIVAQTIPIPSITPSPTITPTPSITPSITPSVTPTPTPTPSSSPPP